MLVKSLNKIYIRLRNTESGFDERLPTISLLHFVAGKMKEKANAALRGRPQSFQGAKVRLIGRSKFRAARGTYVGHGVLINAVSRHGVVMGAGSTIDEHSILRCSGVLRSLGEGITIGAGSAIGAFNFIHGGGGVTIGDNCLLGPYVSVYSENHVFSDPNVPIRLQGEVRKPVVIQDDVWIGSGSTVLAGVTVGKGAVIAAGSVLTVDVPPYHVVGGVPARVIKKRAL